MEMITCPGCGDPGEVVERFVMDSTDGPIEFARTGCLSRHWFTVAVADLRSAVAPPETRTRRWAS